MKVDRGYRPKKTGETVDRRQNNGSVKAVSPRHCPATSALRNCCFMCRAWAESQEQCPLHYCWGTIRSERSPTFAAQFHLPAHDLFWANLRVQLHLPPLDLACNPVRCVVPWTCVYMSMTVPCDNSAAVLRTLSLWPLRTAVETAIVEYTSEVPTALTQLLFWRRSTASSVFRVGARCRAFTPSPPLPRP